MADLSAADPFAVHPFVVDLAAELLSAVDLSAVDLSVEPPSAAYWQEEFPNYHSVNSHFRLFLR